MLAASRRSRRCRAGAGQLPDPHLRRGDRRRSEVRSVPLVDSVDFFGELEARHSRNHSAPENDDPRLPVNPTAQCVELDFFERVVALAKSSTTCCW